MARRKPAGRTESGPTGRIAATSRSVTAGSQAIGAGRAGELNEVDREVIEALAGFRDALRDRVPPETRYTVRQVVSVVPPPPIAPAQAREIRESLGLSQPIFADFLGTSPSTVRSWEQGQKPPSPMARRFLGLIAADTPYWKSRFRSMVQTRGVESPDSGGTVASSAAAGERPGDVVGRRRTTKVDKKSVQNDPGPKTTT